MTIQAMRFLPVVVAIAACGQSGKTTAVPEKVRKAAESIVGPSARIISEKEGGVTIYEAAVQTKLEVELSETGALSKTEIAIPVATLPTAITAAFAGKQISEAEVVVMPSGVAFAIEVGNHEYLVDAAGNIVAQEHEPGDDKDDKDEAGDDKD